MIYQLIKHRLAAVLSGLFLVALAVTAVTASARDNQAPQQPTVVVLSASWCATCREITPLVQNIVKDSQGVQMVTLDVDDGSSRTRAGSYGINIEGSTVPQVYLYNHGRTEMLFNGRNYRFGQSKQAEEQIRQGLTGL